MAATLWYKKAKRIITSSKSTNMGKKDSSISLNSFDIIRYLFEKRKILLIVTIFAALFSAVVSFFINPEYSSEAEIFPSYNQSITRALFQDFANPAYSLLSFGKEEYTESTLPMLESNNVKELIINNFDLYTHYGISKDDSMAYTNFLEQYRNRIKIKKTKYQSIKITVTDSDPYFAANLANAIANYVDTVYRKMFTETNQKALQIAEKRYSDQKDYLNLLVDSLRTISKSGINDYISQAERFNQAYANAIIEGNNNRIAAIERKLSVLAKHGGEYTSIYHQVKLEAEHLSYITRKLNEAKIEFADYVPYKFVVSQAVPNLKKVSPNRKLILIGSSLSAFLFTLITLIIADNVKRVAQKLG